MTHLYADFGEGPHVVIGLGFGDEGKGHVVDWLCSIYDNPSVVRFCGGPQAGHHVVMADGMEHVFSHFGSGTLRGASTHWSRFCPVNPISLINELDDLVSNKGICPKLWVDNRCPITTLYEVHRGEGREFDTRHGTCGAGIYATFKREQDNYHLLFEDLYHPEIVRMKMELIRKYTQGGYAHDNEELDDFLWSCEEIAKSPYIEGTAGAGSSTTATIFEGSQGLMLDQNYGFFPHVTPANTGTTNLEHLHCNNPSIWLVTRAYQTRHGTGPMSKMVAHSIKDNPYEKNRDDGPQGEFRKTLLDLDMLRYAVSKDVGISVSAPRLVVTCMDLLDGHYRLLDAGKVRTYTDKVPFLKAIASAVGAFKTYTSNGPTAEDIIPFD